MSLLIAAIAFADGLPLAPAPSMGAPSMIMPTLGEPLNKLFSHPKHKKTFEKMGLTCTSCHNFSVHPKEAGLSLHPSEAVTLRPSNSSAINAISVMFRFRDPTNASFVMRTSRI